jgi:hypothetical protein
MYKKRLISFSMNPHFLGDLKLDFDKKTEGIIEITACLFSTAYNRNKGYFQVSKLLAWENKLERIMSNFNHNLELTNGKYFGNKTKFTKMWSVMNDGEFEVWATLESSDPEFIKFKDEITAPSIELSVWPDDIITSDAGEYFIDFDFVGVAWLLGVPAGSGDARITAIREFSHDLKSEKQYNITTNNNMTDEQLKAHLDEQKTQLTESFKAQIESIKADYAEKQEAQIKQFSEIVSQSQSGSDSVHEYTDSEGNKYRCSSKSMYASITELIEKGTDITNSEVGIMMAKKGYSIAKEPTELDEAEAKLKEAVNFVEKMKANQPDENLAGRNPAEAPAEAKINFQEELKKHINNKFI